MEWRLNKPKPHCCGVQAKLGVLNSLGGVSIDERVSASSSQGYRGDGEKGFVVS